MTTNQEGVHAAVRAITGTSADYLSDWHALFTANSVAAGPFNERMLSFLNTNLGTSYARLTDAMNAFAVSQGFAGWTDMNTFTLSEAAALLAAESQGLALVFTDDAFYGRDGFYGSAEIKDTGTPANNYSASPVKAASSLLTYTSPSPKLTMGPDGLYRYQAHNLYLNSAAPANQSITVVSGATYAVTITGSVSVTASGAATGTWTAGTNTFTAATTTLTLGSTSGSGTVHVRRTPSDSTYLATAGTIRYDLPYQWDASGNLEGILVEEARTNLALRASDLTNASWTASNVTTAKTATGPDGVANSATTLTATAGNGTVLQAITSASAARITSCFIKRRTGSGTIEMTQDNGSTWAAVTVTSGWTRVNIASATLTDPTVGIRIVTSGDAVDVAYFQQEVGAFITSPIETFGSSVTRLVDDISLATSAFPYNSSEMTVIWKGYLLSNTINAGGLQEYIWNLEGIPRIDRFGDTTIAYRDASIAVDTGLTISTNPFSVATRMKANDLAIVKDGGAPYANASSAAPGAKAYFSFLSGTNAGLMMVQHFIVLPRGMSNAELQAVTS